MTGGSTGGTTGGRVRGTPPLGPAVGAEVGKSGRVMALYSVVFLGSTPIGAPLVGWLSEAYDPRAALLLAASAGIGAAWAGHVMLARRPPA